MMSMKANGLLSKSGTLPWLAPTLPRSHAPTLPLPRSRSHAPAPTLPWHAPPARALALTTRSQARNPNGKHIYQRATVEDLKINLLGKITQNSNAYNDHEGKWAPQEKSTFR